MALKKRVICTLLWGEHGQVKPRAFGAHRARGSMIDAVRVMERRNIDELMILDITDRAPRFDEIEDFTGRIGVDDGRGIFCPLTIGGGVRSVKDAVGLLNVGADKVAVCTAALEDVSVIRSISRKIGCQSVVACIDVKDGVVMSHRGTRPTRWHFGLLAQDYEAAGAGEILITSVARDGTLDGYDLDLIHRVAGVLKVPVIANGGCSGYEDMKAAFDVGADAVAAGALWQFTEATPKGAARYLHEAGVPTRLR